ncbi:MAG: hypothetical protein K5668_04810 [Lachnospiraceae bacterium]|nr:hypothetical protein [Lachnospiraceae bacterium]
MKKSSPLRIIHLTLMIILLASSSISTVLFFSGFEPAVAGKERMEVILNGCSTMVVMLMLLTGVLYLVHGYKKNAAVYYKAFLLLLVLVNLMVIILDILYAEKTPLVVIKCVLYAVKIILLLLMAFGKDLGREKTWLLLYVVVGLDIAAMIVVLIILFTTTFDFSLVGIIAALLADATIGLAIRGKYADKDSRGTK